MSYESKQPDFVEAISENSIKVLIHVKPSRKVIPLSRNLQ
jgi:hypothetical protein